MPNFRCQSSYQMHNFYQYFKYNQIESILLCAITPQVLLGVSSTEETQPIMSVIFCDDLVKMFDK